ncbi:MAG: excinuclease ABC subunit UvrB [Chloroflexi bacterium]|nr:excinuclease ABC subunit UvrB [Chloroflexota bacterium]
MSEKHFKLHAEYQMTGDQPAAVASLIDGLAKGLKEQVLLGVTGSGKTFTMANIIERTGKPTLILCHNKTLAAQLYTEFKEYFPDNAVEYFVSYYDYYQPEAYVPQSDLYIEKDSDINDEIDKLRHAATMAVLERRDVIIIASVSCIYGLGEPEEYRSFLLHFEVGHDYLRQELLQKLIGMQYERNDFDLTRGKFRVKGDTLEIMPISDENVLKLEFFGDELTNLSKVNKLTGEILKRPKMYDLYPAKHFVTSPEKIAYTLETVNAELNERLKVLEAQGKVVEAARLKSRTNYDLEMLSETGYVNGAENYSVHLSGRPIGSRPWTLVDYFPEDFLLIVDESHITLPQVRGMYNGDRARKQTLVDYGFRLPSAMDNRPLQYEEFNALINQVIYVSATPAAYELEHTQNTAEQLIRPTGLLEPTIEVKPILNQVDDLLQEIQKRVEHRERVLVTTLTKKLAEQLTDYLIDIGIKTQYLHSEVDTLERVDILRDLRLGVYDVLVGINLLREGLDLPEVSLVAILDADKEGYLRSISSLVQIMGRAARHVDGHVIMYADKITKSMEAAINETLRRRMIQETYNKQHGILPAGIKKAIKDINERVGQITDKIDITDPSRNPVTRDEIVRLIKELENQMRQSAKELQFERAALLRDRAIELKQQLEKERILALRGSLNR